MIETAKQAALAAAGILMENFGKITSRHIRIKRKNDFLTYVDEKFLTGGFLHRSGGFIFFGIGLSILGLILLGLRRSEMNSPRGREEVLVRPLAP